MKFILTFLLLHCLQSCNIYYNQDISFDLIDLKVDNFPLNEKKTLYINICGNLKYQCQKQEDSVVMVANEASTQNIIITEGKECDFYSREHELNSNDLELITENKPFGGFLLNVQGVEDDKTLKFLLVCKNSQTFQVETLCEYDVCLSHSSVCPDLVYNPLMDLYRDLYIPIGILSMLIGIIFIIFGFRYIRITTILMGFIFSFVLYTIVMSESVLDQDSSGFALIMIICSGIGVAVIYSNCVYTRQLLSYFNVGLVFASVLSLLSQSIFLHFFTPHPMFLALSLILVSSGILFGILAMKFVNGLGIGGTALTGAYLIIRPLAWFVGGYPNEIYLVKQQFYGFSKSIDFRFYLYFSSIFVITIGSIFIQYRQLQQRMSMDQMMQYQDLNYYEMGNFQEKAISSEVKGFQVESEIIKEQFVKKLDNEIRKSNSSNSSN